MIEIKDKEIIISTDNTSLILSTRNNLKLTSEYYGTRIKFQEEIESLIRKYSVCQGTTVLLDEKDNFSNNDLKTVVSTVGNGDYFSPSLIISEFGTIDLFFKEAKIIDSTSLDIYPTPHNPSSEVMILLEDKYLNLSLELHYTTYDKEDVISCYSLLKNNSGNDIHIQKMMSYQLSLVNNNSKLISTYGCWANELNQAIEEIKQGRKVIESLLGSSSARHNPFFYITENNCTNTYGNCYGFNLIYSGNFESSVETDCFDLMRIQGGISSTGLNLVIKNDESFITPIGIFSYSDKGSNGLASNMQNFINNKIISEYFKDKERPIFYNNWEATGMKFNKSKIISLMKKAKKYGIETFVLDDGWFSTRDDDSHGLGDWKVNEKKLPGGLKALSDEAKKLGLNFGIWMEPEMVNEDTETYKSHPDWIIKDIHPSYKGRHQHTLNLAKKEVQDFIIESVSDVLNSADISYLKWDYNRNFSNIDSGNLPYEYIIGLYRVLKEITKRFPHVLFENCASGGNRFDLGMLSYFAQSWMSDDTDSFKRESIQKGAIIGYPNSVMSNHVSCKTSNQLMRKTSLDAKFEVAMHGILGYELDLNDLFKMDEKMIIDQISFYKEYRKTLQWGNCYILQEEAKHQDYEIETIKEDTCIVSIYRSIDELDFKEERLKALYLDSDSLYFYQSRIQRIPLQSFGTLVNYQSPIHLKEDGMLFSLVAQIQEMKTEDNHGYTSGKSLEFNGPVLSQEWSGCGYNENVRLMLDFSSRSYVIKKVQKE